MKDQSQLAQQEQTLNYFRKFAEDWRSKAEGGNDKEFNVIESRNSYVVQVAKNLQNSRNIQSALDVGCGTGELICELGKLGIKSTGIDFSPEMIELAKQKSTKQNLHGVDFLCTSVFDYKPKNLYFDLISANGFIEYISEEQLQFFLEHVRTLLTSSGTLIVGSRNRLFNIFSLNDYTRMECTQSSIRELLEEAIVLANAKNGVDVIEQLISLDSPLPRLAQHPLTKVDVTVRHQYTPGELVHLLQKLGFKTVNLYPVHYQAFLPQFKSDFPNLHVDIANLIQGLVVQCPYLIPYCSTFMIQAVKG